jgi:hypothetical protein
MKTIRAVGFGLAPLADGAGFAAAREPGGFGFDPRECFEQPAANNDKVIDDAEVPESGLLAFERLMKHGDTNKNGKLELEEFRAGRAAEGKQEGGSEGQKGSDTVVEFA